MLTKKTDKRKKTKLRLSFWVAISVIIVFYFGSLWNTLRTQNQDAANIDKKRLVNKSQYIDREGGVRLEFPDNWYLSNHDSGDTVYINLQNYIENEVTDEERSNMNLSREKISLTLGYYSEFIKKDEALDDYLKRTNRYESDMSGDPTSVNLFNFAGRETLDLSYHGNSIYYFRLANRVFWFYFFPNDTLHKNEVEEVVGSLSLF